MSPVARQVKGTGVGCLARIPIKTFPVKINTKRARVAYDLGRLAQCEFKTHPPVPKCMAGDMNAQPKDLPTLMRMTEDEGWVDCGAKAEIWGRQSNQSTCQRRAAGTITRRDYVFADPSFWAS